MKVAKSKIVYSVKIYLINEGEKKLFSDEQKLKEFVNYIPKPKKKLKGVRRKENLLRCRYKTEKVIKNNGNNKYVNKHQLLLTI